MLNKENDQILAARVWLELKSGNIKKAHKLAAPVLKRYSEEDSELRYQGQGFSPEIPKQWVEISKAFCALDLKSYGVRSQEHSDPPMEKEPSKRVWLSTAWEVVSARSRGAKKAIVSASIALAIFLGGMTFFGVSKESDQPHRDLGISLAAKPMVLEESLSSVATSPAVSTSLEGSNSSPTPVASFDSKADFLPREVSDSVSVPSPYAVKNGKDTLVVDPLDSYDNQSKMVWMLDPQSVKTAEGGGGVEVNLYATNVGELSVYVMPSSLNPKIKMVGRQKGAYREIKPGQSHRFGVRVKVGRDLAIKVITALDPKDFNIKKRESKPNKIGGVGEHIVRLYTLSEKEVAQLMSISQDLNKHIENLSKDGEFGDESSSSPEDFVDESVPAFKRLEEFRKTQSIPPAALGGVGQSVSGKFSKENLRDFSDIFYNQQLAMGLSWSKKVGLDGKEHNKGQDRESGIS